MKSDCLQKNVESNYNLMQAALFLKTREIFFSVRVGQICRWMRKQIDRALSLPCHWSKLLSGLISRSADKRHQRQLFSQEPKSLWAGQREVSNQSRASVASDSVITEDRV